MKTCSKCKTTKTRDEFYKRNSPRGDLSSHCRECVKTARKAYVALDRAGINRKQKLLYAAKKYYYTPKGRAGFLVAAAKKRAKLSGLSFDLDREWMIAQCSQPCPLTGWTLDMTHAPEGGHFNPLAPSVDRVDTHGGYTKSNCRVVVNQANLARHQFGDEMLLAFCKAVVKTISSRASQEEGSTTIPKGSRGKSPEAPNAPLQ